MTDIVDRIAAEDLVRIAQANIAERAKRLPARTGPNAPKFNTSLHYRQDRSNRELRTAVAVYVNSMMRTSGNNLRVCFDVDADKHYSFLPSKPTKFLPYDGFAFSLRGAEHKTKKPGFRRYWPAPGEFVSRLDLTIRMPPAPTLAARVLDPTAQFAVLAAENNSDAEFRDLSFDLSRGPLDDVLCIAPALRALWHRESPFFELSEEIKYMIMCMMTGRSRPQRQTAGDKKPQFVRLERFPDDVSTCNV